LFLDPRTQERQAMNWLVHLNWWLAAYVVGRILALPAIPFFAWKARRNEDSKPFRAMLYAIAAVLCLFLTVFLGTI
jgi:phosphoglycerol transferase MdoB-like AlkP superfamily enzyme